MQFDDMTTTNKHLELHALDGKTYSCHTCSRALVTAHHLQRHAITHSKHTEDNTQIMYNKNQDAKNDIEIKYPEISKKPTKKPSKNSDISLSTTGETATNEIFGYSIKTFPNSPIPPSIDATSYLYDFNYDYFDEPQAFQEKRIMTEYDIDPKLGKSSDKTNFAVIPDDRSKLLEFVAFLRKILKNPKKAEYLTSLIKNPGNYQDVNAPQILYHLKYLMLFKNLHPEIFVNTVHKSLNKFLNH